MKWDRLILSRLFISIPELSQNVSFTKALLDKGVINAWQYDVIKTLAARHRPSTGINMRGKPLLERIMLLMPELLSVRMVNVLHGVNLIGDKDAHLMRVLFRTAGRLLPGAVTDEAIFGRMALIFDDIFSSETIAYIRALDNAQIDALRALFRASPENFGVREAIFGHRAGTLTSGDAALIREMLVRSVKRAQILRSVISQGRVLRSVFFDARDKDSVWDVLLLAFDQVFSDRLLRNLVRAGVISPERYALVRSLQNLSAGIWRKVIAARSYEGWAARTLLLSEGVLSPETIRVLVALGRITPAQAQILYPVAGAIREITRGVGARWRKSTRYRVVPGEAPIKTFARYTRQTDTAILKLLASAADDASKDAARLAAGKGYAGKTRAAQQRLVANRVHITMRQLWDDVGSLTIFGEKQAARAAIDAMTFHGRMFGANGEAVQRMLRYTAQSGVDSYISREENLRQLSKLVYRNFALGSGQIDREIAKALIRGLNAQELAGVISRFIRPDVSGGLSYASMRLARTEINNAFHFTQIRYTREMPWVEGYRWQLSGSHGRPDVCDQYAARKVFPKNDMPGKPHPQCLCFITSVTADTRTWYSRYRSGAYNGYLDQVQRAGVFDEDRFTPETNASIAGTAARVAVLNLLAGVARRAADALRT